jgi:hypothetical protein
MVFETVLEMPENREVRAGHRSPLACNRPSISGATLARGVALLKALSTFHGPADRAAGLLYALEADMLALGRGAGK